MTNEDLRELSKLALECSKISDEDMRPIKPGEPWANSPYDCVIAGKYGITIIKRKPVIHEESSALFEWLMDDFMKLLPSYDKQWGTNYAGSFNSMREKL